MHNQQTATPAIALAISSTLPQIQPAAECLTPHPNLDLEVALQLGLQGWILSQEAGEGVAIAVEQRPCTRPPRGYWLRVWGYLRRVSGNVMPLSFQTGAVA